MRLSAALLVLCAALLACTPASATWTGSAPAYVSNEVTAGSCTYNAAEASDPLYKCSSSGTCKVQAASCAAAKAATAGGPYTTTRLEATSATTFCQHMVVDGYGQNFFMKMDCSTRLQSVWILAADQTCTTTPPLGSPPMNFTWPTEQTIMEGLAGGCMHQTVHLTEGQDCEGNGRASISHYRHGINTTSGDLVAEYKKICPSWYTNQVAPPTTAAATTPTATPAPAAAAIHFVTMTVTMPYSKV